MPKSAITIRVSDDVKRKIECLAREWNTTKTEVIAVVVDRVYQERGK